MKKSLVFLLAILYITLSSGVMVNIHYCMGEMTGVKYGTEKDHACGSCGMPKKEGCCHTDHQFMKTGDQVTTYADYSLPFSLNVHSSINSFQQDFAFALTAKNADYSLFHSPPDKRLNSLRFYNCVFTI